MRIVTYVKFIIWVCVEAKITAVIQPISSVIMLLMIAVILGFGAIRIATGAITAGALIAMIFM